MKEKLGELDINKLAKEATKAAFEEATKRAGYQPEELNENGEPKDDEDPEIKSLEATEPPSDKKVFRHLFEEGITRKAKKPDFVPSFPKAKKEKKFIPAKAGKFIIESQAPGEKKYE